jgi:hypothetical protein
MSPLLILSLAGGALWLYTQSSSTTSTAWPPTPDVQNGLVAQLSTMYQSATGAAPSPAMVTEIQAAVNGAPAQYQATLPQGQAPTVAGYQAWVLAKGQAAMSATSPSSSVPAAYRTAGPLGLPGHDPYPMWDVHGNAFFRASDGSVVAVWHSNDQRGDFPEPRVREFAVRLRPWGR